MRHAWELHIQIHKTPFINRASQRHAAAAADLQLPRPHMARRICHELLRVIAAGAAYEVVVLRTGALAAFISFICHN